MLGHSEYCHEDAALVAQCLSGSRKAWDDLYGQYVGLVRRVVVKRSGVRGADLEDMVQNVFVKLCTALQAYDSRHRLSQFIYVIAERICIDEHRQSKAAKREGEMIAFDYDETPQAAEALGNSRTDSQEDQLVKAQLVQLLSSAFGGLEERCRRIIRLRYYEDLPFKEIAGLLGGTENTLTVQARRCLDRLKDIYYQLEQEGLER